MPTNAISVDQLKFKANNAWNGLDEVRIVNSGDALYCKENVTTGLLMKDNQLQVVAVSWTNGVPAIGAKKGYIDANGDYHIWDSSTSADSTSLATLRDSVNQKVIYDEFTIPVDISWGAGNNIGERVAQYSFSSGKNGYQQICATVSNIGASSAYHVLTFFSNDRLYVNFYRIFTEARTVTANTLTTKVLYIKN